MVFGGRITVVICHQLFSCYAVSESRVIVPKWIAGVALVIMLIVGGEARGQEVRLLGAGTNSSCGS
jgi:hypothetical protein